jgi:hypothetical protein
MHLVETRETEDKRSQLTPTYAPRANDLRSAASMRVRKGQHLDVDEILERSLPNLGAFSAPDVKTIVLRENRQRSG